MDTQDEKRLKKILDDLGFLSHIRHDDLRKVTAAFGKEFYKNGEFIIKKGEWGDALYIISRGNAKVYVGAIDEKIREIKTMGEGDFFGEIALIIEQPRTAWVVAEGSVEVFTIRKEPMEAYLLSVPAIHEKITAIAKKRLGSQPHS